jgi:hypothetical protein
MCLAHFVERVRLVKDVYANGISVRRSPMKSYRPDRQSLSGDFVKIQQLRCCSLPAGYQSMNVLNHDAKAVLSSVVS